MRDTSTRTNALADRLRSEIGTVYRPGDSLPSVKAMTGRYGMPFNVVRGALRLLREENSIVSRPRVGHFVPDDETTETEKHDDALKFSSATTLHEQIAHDLRKKITGGRYKAGEKLSSLRVLARHYGVSTMPIRHAVKQLTCEGLIYTSSRSGIYVTARKN